MKNWKKKLVSIAAATVISVASMSMFAEAYDYNLHYAYGAPTSDVVTERTFKGKDVLEDGYFRVTNNVMSLRNVNSVETFGYVYVVGVTNPVIHYSQTTVSVHSEEYVNSNIKTERYTDLKVVMHYPGGYTTSIADGRVYSSRDI